MKITVEKIIVVTLFISCTYILVDKIISLSDSVRTVSLHATTQRLETLQEFERVYGTINKRCK